MNAIAIAIVVSSIPPPPLSVLITQQLARGDALIRGINSRYHQSMLKQAERAKVLLQQLDQRILDVQKEGNAAKLAELKATRAYFQRVAEYDPLRR